MSSRESNNGRVSRPGIRRVETLDFRFRLDVSRETWVYAGLSDWRENFQSPKTFAKRKKRRVKTNRKKNGGEVKKLNKAIRRITNWTRRKDYE